MSHKGVLQEIYLMTTLLGKEMAMLKRFQKSIALLTLVLASSVVSAVQPVASSSWVGSQTGASYLSSDIGLATEKAAWDARYRDYVHCRIWTSVNWVSATTISVGASLSGCAGGGLDVEASWTNCPANSTKVGNACVCVPGSTEGADGRSCSEPTTPESEDSCKRPVAGAFEGFPIFPVKAEKFRSETDWSDSGPGALSFTRTYRSNWASDSSRVGNPLGQVWSHNFATKLVATPSAAPLGVAITTGEGYVRTFGKAPGATTWTAGNSTDTLVQLPSGTWSYRRANDDTTLSFDGSGKLQVAVDRSPAS